MRDAPITATEDPRGPDGGSRGDAGRPLSVVERQVVLELLAAGCESATGPGPIAAELSRLGVASTEPWDGACALWAESETELLGQLLRTLAGAVRRVVVAVVPASGTMAKHQDLIRGLGLDGLFVECDIQKIPGGPEVGDSWIVVGRVK